MTDDVTLESLARARFDNLTAAEIKLLQAAPKGELAVCGASGRNDDPLNDPAKAEEWQAERHIRAELIRWICVDRRAKELVDPGGVRVYGAKVVDTLNLAYVTVPFPLVLWLCHSMAELNLRGADLPVLDLQGTWVQSVAADGMTVRGNLFLRYGFHAVIEVRLQRAKIGLDLDCGGGTFGGTRSGDALSADGAIVGGTVFFNQGFSARGNVRLVKADIGGALDCSGGRFENPPSVGDIESGYALSADNVVVSGTIFLNKGFTSKGGVRLLGAQVGGNLDCSAAAFENPLMPGIPQSGNALSADNVVVNGTVFFNSGFTCRGDVRLPGAEISGNLTCDSATFVGSLLAEGVSVKGAMYWVDISDVAHTGLDLINTSVDSLVDDAKSWPARERLILDGFAYKRFSSSAPRDAKTRLDWLARQDPFTPQPYRQLAKVLSEEGDDWGGRQVLARMELLRRRQESRGRGWPARWWSATKSVVLRRTVGYGYSPGRSLVWLILLVILGWPLYRAGYFAGNIAPSDKDAYSEFKRTQRPPGYYEPFQAITYSFENSFPLVKLGQADRWQPEPASFSAASGRHFFISASFLLWFRRAQIILGWFFATIGLAAVTGFVRRD
jgi:hypothetical protein